MGGTKKNNNASGLGPAKRKEHAKKSLQSRYKNDTEIKRLVKTIQDSKQQQEILLNAKNQLTETSETRELLKSRAEYKRNLCINKLGLNTFIKESSISPNDADPYQTFQLPATLDGFRRAVSCMAMMIDDSKYRLDVEAECQRNWLHGFIHILNKQKVAEDKIKLLQLGSNSFPITTAGGSEFTIF